MIGRTLLVSILALVAVLRVAPIVEAAGLDWRETDGMRTAGLTVPGGAAGFESVPPAASGVHFTNVLGADRHTTNQVFLNGSGVAAGDVDGDGRCDLFFASLTNGGRLYRNLGGWKFADVTRESGVDLNSFPVTGVLLVHLNGDSALDLVLNSIGHGTRVFFNDGRGRFTESSRRFNVGAGAMSAAAGDLDGDGDLDIYIANYRRDTFRDKLTAKFDVKMVDGKPVVVAVDGKPVTVPEYRGRFSLEPNGKVVEHGEADVVLINNGRGQFEEQPLTNGRFLDSSGAPLTQPLHDWGLSVMIRDVNNDQAPDIYVCNDFESPDRFWINQGNGSFQLAGEHVLPLTSMFSMGADFADVDRDGHDDFVVLDMLSRRHRTRAVHMREDLPSAAPPQFSQNTFFLNRGDGTYAETAQFAGLHASEWSWTPIFLDVDLDGFDDLLVSTGHEVYGLHGDVSARIEAMRAAKSMTLIEQLKLNRHFPRLALPNIAFRNRGDLTFEDAGARWRFDQTSVAHGMALADLDNDGDLDVAINNMNDAAALLRNTSSAPRIAVRLRGPPENASGVGARVELRSAGVSLTRQIASGGRYLSCDQSTIAFAAGNLSGGARLVVTWPDGRVSEDADLVANHIYEINHASAETGSSGRGELPIAPEPLFIDASADINHRHTEAPFNDWARQPLLPRSFDRLGPAACWFDIDADGWDDLVIGGGREGDMAVFRNREGRFQRIGGLAGTRQLSRDQTGVVGAWIEGRPMVVAGISNYEDGQESGEKVVALDVMQAQVREVLSAGESAAGPLALADYDADGDLDMFVGGRLIPGKYPASPRSVLLKRVDDRWVLDHDNTPTVENSGMVSGAIWSDVNGDGFSDLILAIEWGSPRLFINEMGKLIERTDEFGLGDYRGWWNGIASGDFNGDGRMDLAVSNFGLNNRFHQEGGSDLQLRHADRDGLPRETWIAFRDPESGHPTPFATFQTLLRGAPYLRAEFETGAAFGAATLEEILGEALNPANVVRVDTLKTALFLNRGSRFENSELPVEAQFSAAFGIAAADLNGDGNEDLFLAQNTFDLAPPMPPQNSGRGLFLQGDGQGGFQTVPASRSGIILHGAQRAAAWCDYDRDGRPDLLVTQNDGPARLFRNRGAVAGLRVRANAGAENRSGIGVSIRAEFVDGSFGPRKEIAAGSGYWAQSSSVLIFAQSKPIKTLHVLWPGGRSSEHEVSPRAEEVAVHIDGSTDTARINP